MQRCAGRTVSHRITAGRQSVKSAAMRFAFVLTLCIAAHSQTPVVSPGSVVDAAGFKSPVAPGALVSIFGSNLAGGLAQADSIPLSTSLNSVSVTFNNIPAPLLFVSGGAIHPQLPWEVLGRRTTGTADGAGNPPAP